MYNLLGQPLTCADISYARSDCCPREANVVLGKIDNESGHPKLAQQDAKCETEVREGAPNSQRLSNIRRSSTRSVVRRLGSAPRRLGRSLKRLV